MCKSVYVDRVKSNLPEGTDWSSMQKFLVKVAETGYCEFSNREACIECEQKGTESLVLGTWQTANLWYRFFDAVAAFNVGGRSRLRRFLTRRGMLSGCSKSRGVGWLVGAVWFD